MGMVQQKKTFFVFSLFSFLFNKKKSKLKFKKKNIFLQVKE